MRRLVGVLSVAAVMAEFTAATAQAAVRNDPSVGFAFDGARARQIKKADVTIRLGEKITSSALRKRFAGYRVRYAKEEDCLTCATISGDGGDIWVAFAEDGQTVTEIKSDDPRARDAFGNTVGASLVKAIGSSSAKCDGGMDTTCASPSLKGLSYIVASDDACEMIVKEKEPTEIPACARIAGFHILAHESGTAEKDGYSLLCGNKILQSSGDRVKLDKMPSPLIFQVQFMTGETTWINPQDKSETVYEKLRLTQGDRVSLGGEVKGSTFGSSTTFDGPFKATGMGTTSWGYAKSFKAHTVTIGSQTYLCKMQSERPK